MCSDPTLGKLATFGLGTTDRDEADRICRDAVSIFSDPDLLKDFKSPRLMAYHDRAVKVVFGEKAAAKLSEQRSTPTLDEDDVAVLARRITSALEWLAKPRWRAFVAETLRGFESKRYAELQGQFQKIENRLKALEPHAAELEQENSRIRREHNIHVTVTISKAWADWKQAGDYTALAPKTQKELAYAVDGFIKTLPVAEKFKLGELRSTHISTWLNGLRTKDGKAELSPATKVKMKRYLSVFLTSTYSQYDLSENPMAKTTAIKGAARSRETIKAITDLARFKSMLAALEETDSYWHALLATAVLAGPRYAELCWMKLEHVNLEGNYLRIATRADGKGTKTGKERSVPIEITTLRRILVDHVEQRRKEQNKRNATAAERSDFLFPSTVDDNPFKPRTLTPSGLWSDNGVFLDAWRAIAQKATGYKPKNDTDTFDAWITRERIGEHWQYGPRDWRHCAGTAMGYAGNDTGRVAGWLGNSENVCRRHYKRPSESGKLWPFRW